jgi:hypothetical protein
MWGTAGWAVTVFVLSFIGTNVALDHARSFDPIYCTFYSASTHKNAEWWEKLEGIACIEDKRHLVKGDYKTYHRVWREGIGYVLQ